MHSVYWVFQWWMNETSRLLKHVPAKCVCFWGGLPYEGISWETLGPWCFPWTHNSLSLWNNQTRGYFWHALEALHITFLCCVDVTMMIGRFIRNAIGGGGGGGVFLGRHRSQVQRSWTQFLASTDSSHTGSAERFDKYLSHNKDREVFYAIIGCVIVLTSGKWYNTKYDTTDFLGPTVTHWSTGSS